MRIIKKIKKVMISAIMAIMLLPKKIFASFDPSTFEELYGPPTEILYGPPELMDEPTFIESIWRMVKTCILPISLAIIFIVGSIIFFKRSKATTKEKQQRQHGDEATAAASTPMAKEAAGRHPGRTPVGDGGAQTW